MLPSSSVRRRRRHSPVTLMREAQGDGVDLTRYLTNGIQAPWTFAPTASFMVLRSRDDDLSDDDCRSRESKGALTRFSFVVLDRRPLPMSKWIDHSCPSTRPRAQQEEHFDQHRVAFWNGHPEDRECRPFIRTTAYQQQCHLRISTELCDTIAMHRGVVVAVAIVVGTWSMKYIRLRKEMTAHLWTKRGNAGWAQLFFGGCFLWAPLAVGWVRGWKNNWLFTFFQKSHISNYKLNCKIRYSCQTCIYISEDGSNRFVSERNLFLFSFFYRAEDDDVDRLPPLSCEVEVNVIDMSQSEGFRRLCGGTKTCDKAEECDRGIRFIQASSQ